MTHSLLSPSASHRWLTCTPSALLESQEPDKDTSFSREGTLAHAHCAFALKEHLGQSTEGEMAEIESLADQHQTGEMLECVKSYTSFVLEKLASATKVTPDAQLLVETKLDLSEYIPGTRGTADAIIIADNTLEVIDFKYGKGVAVKAEKNSQMMLYALGAYDRFSLEYNIKNITMTIVQPRQNSISEFTISIEDLLIWFNKDVKPKVDLALKGEGEFVTGEHCKFCKVRGKCLQRARESVINYSDNKFVTNAQISLILPLIPTIEQWCKDFKDYALSQALKGEKIEGFKLVEGRSNRVITDKELAIALLRKAGLAEYDYLTQPELRGLTELEKNIGKKALNEIIGDLIEKPKGKPTLVDNSDKRDAINIGDDFADIDDKELEIA